MAFDKILIANRGEIAVRIARTAHDLGFHTVAVHSEADADALHVAACDEAVCIGPAPTSESYLRIDAVIDAARRTGAGAIHPGYGFLSENAEFALACADAGLVFIGPPVEAIRLMGSKRLSKIAMLEAGVPCIPGYEGAAQDEAVLVREAQRIGLPLMIKASAGGGGRGMRLVTDAAELLPSLRTASSEAQRAFGSGELILERAVLRPHHVEIQVFADRHGNCLYLGERDCSVQRRHQKVVEESPSPIVTPALRKRMGEAAVAAARSCGYVGAGTVEFLVDAERNFYFLEMNTRLQVEHPVTELVTGLDLVEWQLRVAAGERLPLTQEQVTMSGHAMEVRIYAEDPRLGFRPQTGVVRRWRTPELAGVRVDAGLRDGQEVSPYYDPMLAKVIAHGADRVTAARRLARALHEMQVFGVVTNRHFLRSIVQHPEFLDGDATTAFIAEHMAAHESMQPRALSAADWAVAALALFCRGQPPARLGHGAAQQPVVLTLACAGAKERVTLTRESEHSWRVAVGGDEHNVQLHAITAERIVLSIDGVRASHALLLDAHRLWVDLAGDAVQVTDESLAPPAASTGVGTGRLTAPMDGAIIAVACAAGASVRAGDTLVTLEAMKMQSHISADIDGTLATVHVSTGMQVKSGQLLVTIQA